MSEASGAPAPFSARRINARTVRDLLWSTDAPLSANELMTSTGLSRATVLAVCDDLVVLGWAEELPAEAGQGGRPPRRFRFRSDAGYVVGVDIGDHSIRAAVADLRGTIVGRALRPAGFGDHQRAERDAAVRDAIHDSLADAQVAADRVLVASIGLAAPVSRSGHTPGQSTSSYWTRMSLDPALDVGGLSDWIVTVGNDANLAARAVGAHGEADPHGSYVVLLAGERFGAGIVADGRLVTGRDGGAGDMHFLPLLEGVEFREGLAAAARRMTEPSSQESAATLFQHARTGAQDAKAVVDQLGDRLARVIAVLASLLNPEQVIIGGAIAQSSDQLLAACTARLPLYAQLLPQVTASRLGGDIVLLGALRSARDTVADGPLDSMIGPHRASSERSTHNRP
ncbi:MAG TPA: ROK family protein [Microlunatus sp.]